MKKPIIHFLFLVLFLAMSIGSFASGTITGVIIDSGSKEPLTGASIVLSQTTTGAVSNFDGTFSLKLTAGSHQIIFSFIGYQPKTVSVNVSDDKVTDLGKILLETDALGIGEVNVFASVAIQRKTPVAISTIDFTRIAEKLGTKEFPEILKSTPGIYATKQGGGFGDSRVNLRGFESPNVAVMINGVPVNDMEWGGVYWSNWAGLNDVTRSEQVQRGLGASKVAAPSLGGSVNIVTKTTDAEKGGNISYGVGNDGFNKIGFSVSTGLTEKNWAITLLGAKSSGDGYIQGTEFQSYSYFVNISKKINDSHQISFTAFGAPQWHNQRNNNDKLLISEWQKQPNKYLYNASYGFDMNGQRKVSALNVYNKPQISINHFWTISPKSSLSSAIYASIGDGYGTSGQGYTSADRSNWYGSSSGKPNTAFRAADGTFDYGAIYALNQASTNGSKMIMSKSVNQHKWFGALSTFSTRIGNDIDFYGGVDLRYYKGIHTNVITDLYGGKFFIDATSSRPLLSDQSWTTKKLGVGDIVYRDYDGFVFSQGVFMQAEYNKDNLSTFVSFSGSNTSQWRYDRFYYDKAKAKSETVNSLGFSAKGGANYNIDSKQNVFANVGIISRAPFFSGGAFLQSTTSNEINTNAVNEKAFSAELGYGFKSKYLTANLNVYRTKWMDKTMVRYVTLRDIQESLVANLQGVNALHQGVELDFVAKPVKDLELTGMVSIGDWNWLNNTSGYLYNSQNQPVDISGNVVGLLSANHAKMDVKLKGIHVGNSAQTTAAAGFSYQIIKGFRIGLDGNYYGRNYSYYNVSSIGTGVTSSTYAQPWMIPDAVTVDLNANYRFKIGEFDATLVGNIDNLLDSNYITDAVDGADHTSKTAAVYYGFGRTWSTTLKIKF